MAARVEEHRDARERGLRSGDAYGWPERHPPLVECSDGDSVERFRDAGDAHRRIDPLALRDRRGGQERRLGYDAEVRGGGRPENLERLGRLIRGAVPAPVRPLLLQDRVPAVHVAVPQPERLRDQGRGARPTRLVVGEGAVRLHPGVHPLKSESDRGGGSPLAPDLVQMLGRANGRLDPARAARRVGPAAVRILVCEEPVGDVAAPLARGGERDSGERAVEHVWREPLPHPDAAAGPGAQQRERRVARGRRKPGGRERERPSSDAVHVARPKRRQPTGGALQSCARPRIRAKERKRFHGGLRVAERRSFRIRPSAVCPLCGEEVREAALDAGIRRYFAGGHLDEVRLHHREPARHEEELVRPGATHPVHERDLLGRRARAVGNQDGERGPEHVLARLRLRRPRTLRRDDLLDRDLASGRRDERPFRRWKVRRGERCRRNRLEEVEGADRPGRDQAHQVQVQIRVALSGLDGRERSVPPILPVGAVEDRAIRVEEEAPVRAVAAQEVRAVRAGQGVDVLDAPGPLVSNLVRDHAEGIGDRRERTSRDERPHVDVRLEPSRGAVVASRVEDRHANTLHVVADQVVQAEDVLPEVDMERGKHHEEVVVVAVGAIELPRDRAPRLERARSIGGRIVGIRSLGQDRYVGRRLSRREPRPGEREHREHHGPSGSRGASAVHPRLQVSPAGAGTALPGIRYALGPRGSGLLLPRLTVGVALVVP